MEPTSDKTVREVADTWNFNAKADACWAVLSDPAKADGKWERDEFFATGESVVDRTIAFVEAQGVSVTRGHALDFGCGLGRLTQPLAKRFEKVTGVDISEEMVRRAEELKPAGASIRYVVNEASDLAFQPAESVDFLLCLIVLQHIPPALSVGYLRDFARVLRPGGVLVFQLPARRNAPAEDRSWQGRLKKALPHGAQMLARKLLRPTKPFLPMNGIDRAEVERVLRGAGLSVVIVRSDGDAGEAWESFTYVAKKNV